MTLHELTHAISSPLFGTRDSAKEAYDELMHELNAVKHPASVVQALHILLNSIADEIERAE
jgi:hypothetical protein